MADLDDFILVIRYMITVAIFRVVRRIFVIIQSIVWEWNGTAKRLRESYKPDINYDSCVQVLNVKLIHTFGELQNIFLDNTIYTHNRFENPQYILDNEHVTLVSITEEYALFGEAEEKNPEVWTTKVSPFLPIAQKNLCQRFFVVPIWAFLRLSAIVGDPKAKMIFLFNIPRSGSTLLTQMLQATGEVVAYSEPISTNILSTWYTYKGDSLEMRALTQAVIRLTFKPCQSLKPSAYLLKVTGLSNNLMHLLRCTFPQGRCLFSYREMVDVSLSFYRLTRAFPINILVMSLGKYSGFLTKLMFDIQGFPGQEYQVRLRDDLTFPLYHFLIQVKIYLEVQEKGEIDIRAIRYEDLICDPLGMCRMILKYCHLSESLVELAVRGMEQDSQAGTCLSRTNMNRYQNPSLTPEGKDFINGLLKSSGFPLIGEEWILPGTINILKET